MTKDVPSLPLWLRTLPLFITFFFSYSSLIGITSTPVWQKTLRTSHRSTSTGRTKTFMSWLESSLIPTLPVLLSTLLLNVHFRYHFATFIYTKRKKRRKVKRKSRYLFFRQPGSFGVVSYFFYLVLFCSSSVFLYSFLSSLRQSPILSFYKVLLFPVGTVYPDPKLLINHITFDSLI